MFFFRRFNNRRPRVFLILTFLLFLTGCKEPLLIQENFPGEERFTPQQLNPSVKIENGYAVPWKDGWWVAPYHVTNDTPKLSGYATTQVLAFPDSDLVFWKSVPPAPTSARWNGECEPSEPFQKMDESLLQLLEIDALTFEKPEFPLWKLAGQTQKGESGQVITQGDLLCGIILGGTKDLNTLVLPYKKIHQGFLAK